MKASKASFKPVSTITIEILFAKTSVLVSLILI